MRKTTERRDSDRQETSSFKLSTLQFIKNCENDPTSRYDIRNTSAKLGFNQRRFYDVLHVLEKIGCCPKVDEDTFIWLGIDQAKICIERIAQLNGAFIPGRTLSQMFTGSGCVSIPRVTEEFLLLFISLDTQVLNVIEASTFLSQNDTREKTTRCKLYQVAAILDLCGVLKKTQRTSEFRMNDEFFISASRRMEIEDKMSIGSLLNKDAPGLVNQTILKRREEYALALKNKNRSFSD